MTSTTQSDSASSDAPALRALTTSACLTRPSGTGRTVTSVTNPLPTRKKTDTEALRRALKRIKDGPGTGRRVTSVTTPLPTRQKLWTTFQRRELSDNPILQVVHKHEEDGLLPETRATCCPGIGKNSPTGEMDYNHSTNEISVGSIEKHPAVEIPAMDGHPAVAKPALDDPIRGEKYPAVEKPALEGHPAVAKPALDEPKVNPAVEKPALDDHPAVEIPAMDETNIYPAVEKPAVDDHPAVTKPALDEPKVADQLLRVVTYQLIASLDKGSRSPHKMVEPQKPELSTASKAEKIELLKLLDSSKQGEEKKWLKITQKKKGAMQDQRGNTV